MSQFLVELVTLVVEDVYGDLCSTVFAALAKAGRTTTSTLGQATKLPPKRIKSALAVLIQHHFAVWVTVDGTTFYDADLRHAYSIVRHGKVGYLFRRRFGKPGRQIAEYVLVNGHVKTGQLVADFERRLSTRARRLRAAGETRGGSNAAGEDGYKNDSDDSDDDNDDNDDCPFESVHHVKSVVRDLIDAGYLMTERITMFRSDADLDEDAHRIVRETLFPAGPKGTKETAEFNRQVVMLKRKWRDGEAGIVAGPGGGAKRAKSSKLNTAALQDLARVPDRKDEADDGILNMDTVVRINDDKIAVLLRNTQLVELARRYIGDTTATVYEALLACIEDQLHRCFDPLAAEAAAAVSKTFDDDDEEESLPSTSSGAVLRLVDKSVDLSTGLAGPDSENSSDSGLDGPSPLELLSQPPPSRLDLVRTHLQILSEDPRRFVDHAASDEAAEWHVDITHLTDVLVSTHVDDTIVSRFSATAGRVARLLRATGKLDEKQVSVLGMVQSKHARIVLNSMQAAGYVDVQEVPKESARQTARSLWLWHFDDRRCRLEIIDESVKSMSRIVRRLNLHRQEFGHVVEKAERAAVSADPGLAITRADKAALAMWRAVEHKLLVQLHRLDDVVAALRDFGPLGRAA